MHQLWMRGGGLLPILLKLKQTASLGENTILVLFWMDVKDYSALLHHPKLGASWEGFALEEVIRHLQATPEECYFWATHNQAELDLLVFKDGKRLGFEFKYNDAPRLTTSMKIAFEELKLDELIVIYPGEKDYVLGYNIRVVGLIRFI